MPSSFLYDYAVIGGDMRQVYIAEELEHSGRSVCRYALCPVPGNPCFCAASPDTPFYGNASCVIGPVPLSRDGVTLNQHSSHGVPSDKYSSNELLSDKLSLNQLVSSLQPDQFFFAGNIPRDFRMQAEEKNVSVFDLMQMPSLAYFNTIATAEGAICEAIQRSPFNLHHASCAVLGYGKCGRQISHDLSNLSCELYVTSREETERAQAALIAGQTGDLSDFQHRADEFDFIFNTIPAVILTDEILSRLKSAVTIIDIASAPGGVDYAAAQKRGICAIFCPGLPGKYAPASSACAIVTAVEQTLSERSPISL